MKVKGKAKQLFCMVCAFVASFMLTVTAFASTFPDYDTDYTIFGGKYNSNDSSRPGYIIFNSSRIGLVVFCDNRIDNSKDVFLSGSTTRGYIYPLSSTPVYALYNKVTIVDTNGVPIESGTPSGEINDYELKGGISGAIKHTISPWKSNVKYIQA